MNKILLLLFLFAASIAHGAGSLAASYTANGTAGAGFVEIANQASAPSTPTAAMRIYAASGRLSWRDSSGNTASLILSGNTSLTLPTAFGTGVVTALGVNTGSAGAFVVNGGALGTPSSGTVTNLTGTASININGTVGATTPTTGVFTTINASGAVSGLGIGGLIVPLVAESTPSVWNNMPLAATFGFGTATTILQVDLTKMQQVRLVVNMRGASGASGSVLRLRYFTSYSNTLSDYVAIGTSEVEASSFGTNTVNSSSWINLAAGAKADVFISLEGVGGDGGTDPQFGSITAQFR